MRHAVLDGEAIVQNAKGVADYHALRRELARKRSGDLTYYAFDLLYLNGEDLRHKPLLERKQELRALIAKVSRAFFLRIISKRSPRTSTRRLQDGP